MIRSGGQSGARGLWNLGFSLVDLVKRFNELHRLTSNLLSKLLPVHADGRSIIRPAAPTCIDRTLILSASKTAGPILE